MKMNESTCDSYVYSRIAVSKTDLQHEWQTIFAVMEEGNEVQRV